jgi:hypothetical protein
LTTNTAGLAIPTPDQPADEIIRQLLALLPTGRAIEALACQVQLELQGDESITYEQFQELDVQLDKLANHGVKLASQGRATAAK